ncbi:MAG: hypothetical protein FWC00_05995 [Firmicutes bacterium]|nr:hypothetical protein [Bacillota bacterium]
MRAEVEKRLLITEIRQCLSGSPEKNIDLTFFNEVHQILDQVDLSELSVKQLFEVKVFVRRIEHLESVSKVADAEHIKLIETEIKKMAIEVKSYSDAIFVERIEREKTEGPVQSDRQCRVSTEAPLKRVKRAGDRKPVQPIAKQPLRRFPVTASAGALIRKADSTAVSSQGEQNTGADEMFLTELDNTDFSKPHKTTKRVATTMDV